MPLGEIIGEVILRPIAELVVYTLGYWTGFMVLKGMTLGSIRLAPFSTIHGKNRSKKKWHQIDWSIWLHRPMQGRALKAECTCTIGILVWAVLGVVIYFGTRENEPERLQPKTEPPAISRAAACGTPMAFGFPGEAIFPGYANPGLCFRILLGFTPQRIPSASAGHRVFTRNLQTPGRVRCITNP